MADAQMIAIYQGLPPTASAVGLVLPWEQQQCSVLSRGRVVKGLPQIDTPPLSTLFADAPRRFAIARSDDTVVPYEGDVLITCSSIDDPFTTGPSPAPTPPAPSTEPEETAPTTDDTTRAPVEGTHAPGTAAPVEVGGGDGGDDGGGGGGSNTVVIAAGAAGGVALLAIVGAVAYKVMKKPPPPPSYDDLVGA